jgi:hypothetical protein
VQDSHDGHALNSAAEAASRDEAPETERQDARTPDKVPEEASANGPKDPPADDYDEAEVSAVLRSAEEPNGLTNEEQPGDGMAKDAALGSEKELSVQPESSSESAKLDNAEKPLVLDEGKAELAASTPALEAAESGVATPSLGASSALAASIGELAAANGSSLPSNEGAGLSVSASEAAAAVPPVSSSEQSSSNAAAAAPGAGAATSAVSTPTSNLPGANSGPPTPTLAHATATGTGTYAAPKKFTSASVTKKFLEKAATPTVSPPPAPSGTLTLSLGSSSEFQMPT